MDKAKLKYRPEIDGLRAFAVLAVILYHAKIYLFGVEIFQGGFIGVDIFFVISGFLISRYLINEVYINKSFQFKSYIIRRTRRIIPAFLVVIFFSILIGIFYLQPIQLKQLCISILYSLGLLSNYYFDSIATGYFAENSLFIPLLHYWSLSVEEQIYILLPIIILFAYRYSINLLKLSFVLILLSFVLIHFLNIFTFYPPYIESNFHIHEGNFLFKFYFTQSRLWEFLLGTIVAYLSFNENIFLKNKKILYKIFSYLGLILIVLSFVFFNKNIFHPSYATLFPLLGVTLILFFSDQKIFITNILSNKYIKYIGLISYSLYLWHYPIFTYARYANKFDHLHEKFFLIFVTFIISILSYHYIEKVFRSNKVKINLFLIYIFSSLLIIILSCIYIISISGNVKNYPKIISKYDYKTFNLLKSNGRICFESAIICEFNADITNKIFLVGDSVAGSLSFSLKENLVAKNYNFTSATIGCWYLPNFNEYDLTKRYFNEINNECSSDRQNYIKNRIIKNNKNIVILAGKFPKNNSKHITNSIDYKTGIKKEILDLLNRGHYVIVIYPLPELNFNPHKNLIKNNYTQDNIPIFNTPLQKFYEQFTEEFLILDSIKHSKLIRIYPHNIFCNTYMKDKCVFNTPTELFYIDEGHPSLEGSFLINKLILKEIEKIFRRN